MGRLPNHIEHRTFNIEHRMKAAGAGVHAGKGDTRVSNTGLPLPSHSYSFIPRKRRRFRPQPHGDGSGISILGRLN